LLLKLEISHWRELNFIQKKFSEESSASRNSNQSSVKGNRILDSFMSTFNLISVELIITINVYKKFILSLATTRALNCHFISVVHLNLRLRQVITFLSCSPAGIWYSDRVEIRWSLFFLLNQTNAILFGSPSGIFDRKMTLWEPHGHFFYRLLYRLTSINGLLFHPIVTTQLGNILMIFLLCRRNSFGIHLKRLC